MVLNHHGANAAPGAAPALGEVLYLSGRPSLKGFVRYVTDRAWPTPARSTLVETWQAARAHVKKLEKREAGVADHPRIERLGRHYEPLLLEFFKDPLVRPSFNSLPTDIALVPLDRLVVYQKHIDVTFAEELRRELGDDPDEPRVFRACLGQDRAVPQASWSSVGRGTFVFVSPSADLRFLGAAGLKPGQVTGWSPAGNVVGVVGNCAGFGTNFLNALFVNNRLILNNGSHRAYALRAAGVTHVPCVIQHVADRDELAFVGPEAVRRHPELYLEHPRPPMLKDYFDPELRLVMQAQRRVRQVTVRFQVEECFVPALEPDAGDPAGDPLRAAAEDRSPVLPRSDASARSGR